MISTNDNIKPIALNQFIDNAISEAVSLGTVNLKEEDPDKKSELGKNRKELKKHHKMLMEKSLEHYEKDDKEMGKKYLKHARKLASDMEDENKELSLSDYDIDESSLGSNDKMKKMSKTLEDLEIKFAESQTKINDLNIKLSAGQTPSKDDVLADLKKSLEKAQALIEGGL